MSVNEDFKNPAIAENNIYKYRVGKKWFSFDKSILPPEDLRIFELANWQDKLKLITIYKDLKHVEDDSVMILKTKTEKPTKDKRRNLYNEKRRKLNEQLVEANEKNNTAEIEKIVKEIKELNVEFADVINIDTAETVNITRANNVVLNDVKNIINKVNETVRTLTDEDFKTIKNDVEQLVQAKTEQDLTNTINAIKTKMEEISDNSLSPTVEAGVNKINDLIKELERKLDSVDLTPDFEAFKYIFGDKYGWNDLTNLKIIEKIEELKTRAELTDADVNEIITYKEPIKTEIEKYNNKQTLAFIAHIGTYIRIYKALTREGYDNILFGYDVDPSASTVNGMRFIKTTKIGGEEETLNDVFDHLDLFKLEDNKTFVVKCKYIGKEITNYKGQRFEGAEAVKKFKVHKVETPTENTKKTLDIVETIIDNEDTPAEEETAAVETGGFLGLRTNKQAKKEIEELKKEFLTKLQEQAEQIKALKKEIEQLRETTQRFINEPSGSPQTTTKPQILNVPRVKTPVLYTSEDLEQAAKNLKHVQPVRLSEPFGRNTQPELTDLEKVLKRRRADIEYTDDLTDDEDYFADGLKGGLLGELQRDLDKYGLVLSLSPDKTAYFVNVFNRKKTRGSGVEEAKKIVNSVNDNTQYKDLKKLYEDLYED